MWPWTRRSGVKDIVQAEKDTIAGLEAAKGYIRYELKERMGVRHVPDLAFLADRSGRFQARIEELMDRSRKRNKFAPNRSQRPNQRPSRWPESAQGAGVE
jgi:ribosome-binding factor A